MLRSGGFSAVLDKMAPVVKRLSKESADTVTTTLLKFRVNVNGDSQYFLESLQNETNIPNLQSLFDNPIAWDRVRINMRDFTIPAFSVVLEDVEFDAKLQQIDVSKKMTKSGIDKYTYIITLEKDEDAKIDSIMSNQYLKKYTTDSNDKKVLAEFNVTMTPAAESSSDTKTM